MKSCLDFELLQYFYLIYLFFNRIPYDVLINDLDHAIKSQVSPRGAQMTLAEFDYNVYHPFEEVNKNTT